LIFRESYSMILCCLRPFLIFLQTGNLRNENDGMASLGRLLKLGTLFSGWMQRE
jgi:hypothetical protein